MPKYNIDDILNELGVDDAGAGKNRRPDKGGAHPHRDEDPSSPLPSAPAHQGTPVADGSAGRDPVPHRAAPGASVGKALNDLYSPEQEGAIQVHGDFAELLITRHAATNEQIGAAQQLLKQHPSQSLAELVMQQGAEQALVQRCVAETNGLAFERIDVDEFDRKAVQRLGVDFCKQNQVLPLRTDGSRAVIGSVRSDIVFLVDEIKRSLGVAGVKLVVVTADDVNAALENFGYGEEEEVDLSDILADVDEDDVEIEHSAAVDTVDLEQQAGESPVIRYVNYIIQTAVKEGASDIHVEPAEKKLKIRYRIDGLLFEMMNPPAGMGAAITSRLKIMANLDIAERRIPQDGRIRCTVQGRKLDLRVSTLPTPTGEKTVMRILDTKSIAVGLEDLGFEEHTLDMWRHQVKAPHGIVLVTGPTGSGKTTTLYASLRQLDKNKFNISTVEDPVEYHLDGITQTQTHEKIGMTFARALRALLRQDPDVIMVGEIRDHETAHIAVQAALTGHLVLSTLHTNDAPSSITRLVNIGLEPFLVGAAINAVLAQRLVRRLCQHCREEIAPSEEMAEYLHMQGMDTRVMWAPKGCERCRSTGFSGRVGVYEMLTIDDQVRDIIARNPNVAEFRRMCMERGMVPLRQDGLKKVKAGLTTVQEVLRVTEANI